MTAPKSITIVGGGIGGVSTAGSLRDHGFSGDISIIDAGEFPYDRPPLSKAFLAGDSGARVALRPAEWYDQQAIRLISRSSVSSLSPATGEVILHGGSRQRTDAVVLATGGTAVRPPIPGAYSSHVHVLRTLEDAERLRDTLQPGLSLLIVGAGLIGAEVASTALARGCDVVMTDPPVPPLLGAVGPELASWLHDDHVRHGIQLVPAAVSEFRESAAGVWVGFADERAECRFDAVLLAVGMTPDTRLAQAAGLDVDAGVVVGKDLRTSNPNVFAVGDVIRIRSVTGLLPRAEHWDAAVQDAEQVVATLLGTAAPLRPAPWFWTDRHGTHVEVVGRMSDATERTQRGGFGASRTAIFGLKGSALVAVAAINDPIAIRAGRRIIEQRLKVDPEALADTAVDLRKMLRELRSPSLGSGQH